MFLKPTWIATYIWVTQGAVWAEAVGFMLVWFAHSTVRTWVGSEAWVLTLGIQARVDFKTVDVYFTLARWTWGSYWSRVMGLRELALS